MLEARNLAKTFNPQTANEVRALNGVDLAVEEGSWVIVVGTNGSGKSSLLNAIAGGFFVDAGTISLAGQDLTGAPEHERAKFIGRVFQNPFSGTAADMSIAENFALAARRGMRRGLTWALRSESEASAQGTCAAPQPWTRGPSGQYHRQPIRRPATGSYLAHGHLGKT